MDCKYIEYEDGMGNPRLAKVNEEFNNRYLKNKIVESITGYVNENELPFWNIKFSDKTFLEIYKPIEIYYDK